MKKLLTLFALSAVTVSMVNCSSSKKIVSGNETLTVSSSDIAVEMKKNYSADQLEEGKNLMMANCQKCHKIKEPQTRTVEKLERVLPGMIKKAKLTDEQGTLVRAYMLSQAKGS